MRMKPSKIEDFLSSDIHCPGEQYWATGEVFVLRYRNCSKIQAQKVSPMNPKSYSLCQHQPSDRNSLIHDMNLI